MMPKEAVKHKTDEYRGETARTRGTGTRRAGKAESTFARGDGAGENSVDEALFLKLKELRSRLSQEAKVPAYIVFSDASLRDMCRQRPQNPEQFLNVTGVGAVKLEKYGDAFLALIREQVSPGRNAAE
jgi:ATP-dependent DNA helicase RecQ